LAALGYDAEWHCIPAAAVGAPHIRDRVWIIAYPQHSNGTRPHRTGKHLGGNAESIDEQVRFAGPLGAFLANAECGGWRQSSPLAHAEGQSFCASVGPEGSPELGSSCEDVADTGCCGQPRSGQLVDAFDPAAAEARQATQSLNGRPSDQWLVEPDVGRVAHGVPARVDRLRGLGNAVVPQIPEMIGRAILEAEKVT